MRGYAPGVRVMNTWDTAGVFSIVAGIICWMSAIGVALVSELSIGYLLSLIQMFLSLPIVWQAWWAGVAFIILGFTIIAVFGEL